MEPNNNPTQNPNQSTGAFPGTTPVSPVTPTSPAAPVTPTTPVQPIQPIQPLQPTQPISTTQLMQSAQPIQPAQPMQPASPIFSSSSSSSLSSSAQPTQPVGAASLDLSTPITTSQPEISSVGDGLIGHSFSVDKSQNDGNSTPNPFNSTANSNPITSPLAQSDSGTNFASGIENNNSGSFEGVISSNTTTNSVAFNDPAKTTSNNQSVSKDGLSRKPKKTNLIVLIAVAVVVIIALVVVLVMQMNGGGLSSSMQGDTVSDSGEAEDAWEVMKGTLLVCEMKPLDKINDQDVESATVTYLVEDNKITTTSVSLEILDEDGEVGFMKELSSYDGLFMGENIEADEIIEGDGTLKVDLQVFANRLAELLDGDSRLENVSCTVELT